MSGFNINDFKERVSILKVIENFLPVKKEGNYYKACCPFHHEKTPSLVINDEKGFFHCFGCNISGDAISFIEKLKKVSFKEALAEVAKLENIELLFNPNTSFFNEALKALKEINDFFSQCLENEPKAKSYFLNRDLNESDFLKYGLGFVPSKEKFLKFLQDRDFIKIALKIGLISKDKTGVFHSIFCNRLSFAFKDTTNKVRGFSTRELIPNVKLSKYINSKNSDVFNKSFILYNFNNAKATMNKENALFICEGFFDAIAFSKLGFKNVISTSGTAFSKTHLALLLKHSRDKELSLIFLPDKDKAGYKSVIRSLKLCFDNEFFSVKIAVLKAKCKDLGEFLQVLKKQNNDILNTQNEALNKEEKQEKLKAFLEENFLSFNAYEFYLKYHLKRLKSSFEKDKFLKEQKEFLRKLKSFFVKSELTQIASEVFGIDEKLFNVSKVQTSEIKQDKNALLKKCIKTALSDEVFKISFDYFVPLELLQDFKQDYTEFKTSKKLNETLLILLSDESIKILKPEQKSLALKTLLKNHYQKELQNATKQKDFKTAHALSTKIKDLSNPF